MPILLSIALACLAVGDDRSPWVDLVRDAQATNLAKVHQGSANVVLRFIPARSATPEPTELEADIFWREEQVFERYKFLSTAGYPLPQRSTIPLEDTPWNYILDSEKGFFFYNSASKVLLSDRAHRRGAIPSILALEPMKAWFGCCPPSTNDSRPWSEMIDLRIKTKTGDASQNSYEKRANGQVVHTRRDPDGFTLVVTYDLGQGGNPVLVTSIPVDPKQVPLAGSYHWRPVGDAFVLDRCEFRDASPRYPHEPETYSLTVRKVVLGPNPDAMFDQANLLRQLKGHIRIRNLVTNRETIQTTDQAEDEATFKALSGRLKASGFGRPR